MQHIDEFYVFFLLLICNVNVCGFWFWGFFCAADVMATTRNQESAADSAYGKKLCLCLVLFQFSSKASWDRDRERSLHTVMMTEVNSTAIQGTGEVLQRHQDTCPKWTAVRRNLSVIS